MNDETWIGECHLIDDHGEEYHCHAAVWCSDYRSFQARLEEDITRRKHRILWLEEVVPAVQYIARHPTQLKIGPLSRVVHSGHPVEIGPSVRAKASEGVASAPEQLFNVTIIDDITPLGAQFGEFPKKTVPDVLVAPVFGQITVNDSDTHMHTYAVLDAAKLPNLLHSRLSASGLQFQSLFQGDAQVQLAEAAPYLVRLDDGHKFTRELFTGPEGISGLWNNRLGILIRSEDDFSRLRSHLRKFTRVKNRSGAWHYFRFWDPTSFDNVTPDNIHDFEPFFTKFMGPRISKIILSDIDTVKVIQPSKQISYDGDRSIGVQPEPSDLLPFLRKDQSSRLHQLETEILDFTKQFGTVEVQSADCRAILLALKDQFGFAYSDDLYRAGCGLAARGAVTSKDIQDVLSEDTFSCLGDHAIYLFNAAQKRSA